VVTRYMEVYHLSHCTREINNMRTCSPIFRDLNQMLTSHKTNVFTVKILTNVTHPSSCDLTVSHQLSKKCHNYGKIVPVI
jgi:hypothetical protein